MDRCMLFSFQGSWWPQTRPPDHLGAISTFAAPGTSGGSQRGRIARLLRGRLHRREVEEVEEQSLPLSSSWGPVPPNRSAGV